MSSTTGYLRLLTVVWMLAPLCAGCGLPKIDPHDSDRALVPVEEERSAFAAAPGWGGGGGGSSPGTCGYGDSCTTHSDCQSNICAYGLSGSSSYCSKSCTQGGTDCPGTDQCKSSSKGYICRKDDVGGTTPDSGGGKLDGGAPPPKDTKAPQVSITSPSQNAQVTASTKVVVKATDDTGVANVELKVDNLLVASKSAAPYDFQISLQPGTHVLTAVAHDKAQNKGQAQVTVTVPGAGPQPKTPTPDASPGQPPVQPSGPPGSAPFGSVCKAATDCQSKLCVFDDAFKANYCSQDCGPQGWCPAGSTCVTSAGTRQMCGLLAQQQSPQGGESGMSCAISSTPGGEGPLAAAGLLLLLLLWRRRRRARR